MIAELLTTLTFVIPSCDLVSRTIVQTSFDKKHVNKFDEKEIGVIKYQSRTRNRSPKEINKMRKL